MRTGSLRARLTLGLLASLLAVFALQWWLVHRGIAGLIQEQIAGRLQHDAEQLLAALSFDPVTGVATLDANRPGAIYRQPYSGHYYWLRVDGQHFRSRSLWDADLEPRREHEVEEMNGPRGQVLLVYGRRYAKAGRVVEISVAEDLTPLRNEMRQLQFRYAVLTGLLLLLLLLAQQTIVQTGLRPLGRLRRELVELGAGARRALDPARVPQEVLPLVSEFNRLIDVLRQRLARSRESLGNLAHAVKTPLTLLTQQVEQAVEMPQAWRKEAAGQIDLLRQRVERELNRARLAGPAAPGQRFSVDRDLPPLLDTLQRLYAGKAIAVDHHACVAGACGIDRDDMIELLGNLLDNACKWARSRIVLAIGDSGGCHVVVEDDGPGVSEAEAAMLAVRGSRLDEGRPGHGLGLAIVADMVEQYGGRLQPGRSPTLGGMRMELWLPCNDA